MELLKFFIKDEVPAVGLTKFKEKKDKYGCIIREKFIDIFSRSKTC